MIPRLRRWYCETLSPVFGYSIAVLLAAAPQVARIPLHPATLMPFIAYVPFVVVSAALGGLGPGMLTTGICLLESLYFATEPLGSFKMGDPRLWGGLGALAGTGLVASTLFESLKRAWRSNAAAAAVEARLARELETRQRMLESIVQNSPAAIAVLRGPEFTFVMANPAHEALVPGEPLVGRTVASAWKTGAPRVIPILTAVRDAQTAYHATGVALPVDRGQTLPVEERYFDLSCVPLAGPGGEAGAEVLVVASDTTEHKRADAVLRAAYSQLTAIHANVPVALLVIDEQLQVQEANGLATQFAGRESCAMSGLPAGGALGCLDALADPRGCGHQPSCDRCELRLAIFDTLTSGTRREGIEAWLPMWARGQRQRRCLLVSTIAMKFDGATKVLVCAQDITERKQAEGELARQRDELQRQAELIYFSRDAIITADANRVIRGWNRGAEEMYGWTEAETVGNVMHLFLRTSSVVSPAQIDECLAREERWEGELEHSRRDGQRILVDSRQVLLRDAAGTDVRIMEIDRDITQRRRAEDALKRSVRQLESALAEKTVLLKEIHHRVKNNLAVTASLLSMTADGSGPETKLALEESQQRVHSIALVHEYLYDNDRLDHINFGEYARDLVQGVYSAFGGEHKRIGLDLELDPIELGIERAVPCALILNELVSNAFKYAFADGRTGRVLVSFRQPEPGCCELAVEDDGVGLPDGALGGQSKSLGLRIVGILTNQLDGSVEQKARSGTRIVLRFPAAA